MVSAREVQAPPAAPRTRRARLTRALIIGVPAALIGACIITFVVTVVRVQHAASGVRHDLATCRSEVTNDQLAAATKCVHDAKRRIQNAVSLTHGVILGTAAHLPLVSGEVSAIRKVASGGLLVVSGADEFVTTLNNSGGSTDVIKSGRVDLRLSELIRVALVRFQSRLDAADVQLRAVHGGWTKPGVSHVRSRALTDVQALQQQVHTATRLLGVLPEAVGADRTRRYVIAILNSGELRFSGGAALGLAVATFDKAVLHIGNRGETSELTGKNLPTSWTPVPGDTWVRPAAGGLVTTPLVNSTFSPQWPVAGEELLRAYQAQFGVRPDGVIALDAAALADLLREVGPMQVPGYGKVTGGNIVQKLRASYASTSVAQRHQSNNALMDAVLTRLVRGGQLLAKVRGLGLATHGRHLQMFFRDKSLESLAMSSGAGGALPAAATGDFIGVFTQNTNASKVDFYQRRAIDQSVTLHADGSASVVRTVQLNNDAPALSAIDTGRGYLTAVSAPFMALYMPATAANVQLAVNGVAVRHGILHDNGLSVTTLSLRLLWGQAATVTLSYSLPPHTFVGSGALKYTAAVAVQPTINDASINFVVNCGQRCAGVGNGWHGHGDSVTYSGDLSANLLARVVASPE